MKNLQLSLLILFVSNFICSRVTGAEPPPAPLVADLSQLKAEYEKRRAEALRPVVSWYRAQLELLGHQVEEERHALASTFWQDDQPELLQALVKPNWIWKSEMDRDGVAVTFMENGSVHHVGLEGTWKITGPSEVTVQPTDDEPFILRFNASLNTFLGNRRGVTGERFAPPTY